MAAKINYSVTIVHESGDEKTDLATTSYQEAYGRAVALADESKDRQVYVEWYRASDGQRGYLNRDGSNNITGKAF